ncbi:MAG: sarcosine oxidase subunit gamma [Sulfitobacter sp.]
MGELKAITACEGLLPLTLGAAKLEEVDAGYLTSLAAFGDAAPLSAALEKAHGMALPKPNRATGKEGGRCIWFGRGEVLLMGPAPHTSLGKNAAVVDLSDGWACVELSGAAAVDVLARLVPVDLRDGVFKRGHSVRTQVLHMSASITRVGADRFQILVFRSMAATLVHDLKQAMAGVAARG